MVDEGARTIGSFALQNIIKGFYVFKLLFFGALFLYCNIILQIIIEIKQT